ncbi:unnamed protein product [Brassica rapa]|nr:unnamed protein product [Brassica napus]CAG7859816.1 unnamed protein product [Brassica rapa]CDY48584.1 BnaA09g01800D [Brassica napus]VDC58329.1 unnamed protein product [Brassica rapa]
MEMKQATEEDVFPDGTFLGKGSRAYFSIYAMGRMKSIWGEDHVKCLNQRGGYKEDNENDGCFNLVELLNKG